MSNVSFYWPAGKSGAIMVAENIVDKSICSELLNQFKKNYSTLFSPGPTLGGVAPSIKKTMDMSWSNDVLLENNVSLYPLSDYEQSLAQNLFQCIEYYREQFRSLWEWNDACDTGFRVQEYKKGFGYYREHVDGGMGPESTNCRVLGAVIYLNDVEVGGGTYFPEHDVTVPAKAGSISLFPAYWTHPHQGCVPISDDKWIISTFVLRQPPKQDDQEVIISSTPMPQEK
jgi:hypothetical protein